MTILAMTLRELINEIVGQISRTIDGLFKLVAWIWNKALDIDVGALLAYVFVIGVVVGIPLTIVEHFEKKKRKREQSLRHERGNSAHKKEHREGK